MCTAVFLHCLVASRASSSRTEADADADADGGSAEGAAADAFAWGLAAACARCTHELPAFERSEVEALRGRVRIEAVSLDEL